MNKVLTIVLVSFSLASCFGIGEKKVKKVESGLGERSIQYYANKTVASLQVPPDLTKPSAQGAFKLSEYVSGVREDTVSFSKNKITDKTTSVLATPTNIEVKKLGQIRWLLVDKSADEVWNLTNSFLKSQGFSIKRADKKIGVIETDFLENRPEIPDASVGLIRSLLKKAISARYSLPIIDKYRVRIEPANSGKKTEVYLTLNSMEEVITKEGGDNENTIWQVRSKDVSLEAEMLYQLMTYLGSDRAAAREKIIAVKAQKKAIVEIVKGVGGYAKLKFSLPRYDTWENVGWALDQLNVDIEDRDVKEGSFYINVAKEKDKGILSRFFGDDAIRQSYQIIVKEFSNQVSEVYFNDLSEKNSQATLDFSYELLGKIAKQF